MRLNCLLKSGRPQQAAAEFKALFARQRLQPFSQLLSRPALAALLQSLDEKRLARQVLFPAEERRRRRIQARAALQPLPRPEPPFPGRIRLSGPQLRPGPAAAARPPSRKIPASAEKILVKTRYPRRPRPRRGGTAAADRQELAPGPRAAVRPGADPGRARGSSPRPCRITSATSRPSREKDEEYWKTVWLLAWIHYRQDDKEKALEYFRLGSDSPVPGYRIASRYWQGKLEDGKQPGADRLSLLLLRGQGAGGQGALQGPAPGVSLPASTILPGSASWRSSRT